jgi:drug/metabolite transporter (DMT)-like permease
VNQLLGVALKVASTLAFTAMATQIKLISDRYPVGEIVFCRCFFALIPVFVLAGAQHKFFSVGRTTILASHVVRVGAGALSMFLGFSALGYLPIADATAIGYASPLFTVIFAVILLHERVRLYRWSAVIIGLLGVLVILTDYVDPAGQPDRSVVGALLQVVSSIIGALASIQTRRLTKSESANTIVFYFMTITALLSLVTLPFGWRMPDAADAALLVSCGVCGGIGQVLLTQSYRHGDASVLAPFDYVSMIWAVTASLMIFGDVPTSTMLAGAAIVIAAGLFVIFRERQLGLGVRPKAPTPPLA